MVTRRPALKQRDRSRGSLSVELTVALGILALAILPLSVSFHREQALLRALYQRAVAMEIVDGEMEVLAAGEWRSFPRGTHSYAVRAESAKNLPPGRFVLTVVENRVRLEWRPDSKGAGGAVVREIAVQGGQR